MDAAAGRMLQGAGLAIWAAVGLPTAVDAATGRIPFDAGLAGWVGAWLVWLAAFVAMPDGACGNRRALVLLGAQTASALVLVALARGASEAALLVAVAGQLPFVGPPRTALAWACGQTLFVALLLLGRHPARAALVTAVAFGAFQLFALGIGLLAQSEARARRELAAAHAELLGTRELLAQASRSAERLRISRELHDGLGHHLTALALDLEAAVHLAQGPAAEAASRARAVARLLLAEVRDVVQESREERAEDLGAALRALAEGVRAPRVHLVLPDAPLAVRDDEAAHALYRCVQEVVTNAVRHAHARNLWITVTQDAAGVRMEARDDGRGAARVVTGLGLTGMSERLGESGGDVSLSSAPGRGFSVVARVPAARP